MAYNIQMFDCFVTFVSKYFATKHLLIPCMHRRLWMYRPTAEGPPGYAHPNWFSRQHTHSNSCNTFSLHIGKLKYSQTDWLLFVSLFVARQTKDNISSMSTWQVTPVPRPVLTHETISLYVSRSLIPETLSLCVCLSLSVCVFLYYTILLGIWLGISRAEGSLAGTLLVTDSHTQMQRDLATWDKT